MVLSEEQMILENTDNVTIPTEVLELGNLATDSYRHLLLRPGSEPCRHLRIMTVGYENVGKSSLVDCLLRPDDVQHLDGFADFDKNRLSTEKMELILARRVWPSWNSDKSITVGFWDHDGQEIYHVTRELFCSERVLYLVVFSLEDGKNRKGTQKMLDLR